MPAVCIYAIPLNIRRTFGPVPGRNALPKASLFARSVSFNGLCDAMVWCCAKAATSVILLLRENPCTAFHEPWSRLNGIAKDHLGDSAAAKELAPEAPVCILKAIRLRCQAGMLQARPRLRCIKAKASAPNL